MIQRFQDHTQAGFPGVDFTSYKDEPGTWVAVTRRVLAEPGQTKFETRYFEVAPGGYTSYEKHGHEHVVVVLQGSGKVKLGTETHEIGPGDCIHVPSWTPHQFENAGETPFGILCVVDRERDRPVLLHPDGTPKDSENQV